MACLRTDIAINLHDIMPVNVKIILNTVTTDESRLSWPRTLQACRPPSVAPGRYPGGGWPVGSSPVWSVFFDSMLIVQPYLFSYS